MPMGLKVLLADTQADMSKKRCLLLFDTGQKGKSVFLNWS